MPPRPQKQNPNPVLPPTTTRIKTGSILDRIQPLDFSAEDGIKMTLYGRSGTGKTTLWATFPKPILALIASGGKKPGELRSVNTPENRGQIDPFIIEECQDVPKVLEEVRRLNKYKTVVLDHATGLQDLVLKEILGLAELPVQKGWGFTTQQNWGQVGIQTKEYLRALLDLSCNVVIVAQERNFNDEANSDLLKPVIGAALSPSTTAWLNAATDYIGNTFIRPKLVSTKVKQGNSEIVTQRKTKEVEYCLRTFPDSVYTTKFRVPKGYVIPEVIIDPDYDKIVSVINGTYKTED